MGSWILGTVEEEIGWGWVVGGWYFFEEVGRGMKPVFSNGR